MEASAGAVPEPITVRSLIEERDFFDATGFRWRMQRRFLRALMVALVIVGVVTELLDNDPTIWVPSYVLAVAIAVHQFLWIPQSIRNRARPFLGERFIVTIDKGGVQSDLGGFTEGAEWKLLTGVVETDTVIVILRERTGLFYVPTRIFASSTELDAFVAYVRTHLGTKPAP